MTLGVGMLATPWLLAVLADLTGGAPGSWIRVIALELSPARSPGILLILSLAALSLPMLVRITDLAGREVRPARLDAAKLMGASELRARRIVEDRWLGLVPGRPALLALALASTNLAPALLLTPFAERQTLRTAVLNMEREGDPVAPLIGGPILAILAVNSMAFTLASRSRGGTIGDWFEG